MYFRLQTIEHRVKPQHLHLGRRGRKHIQSLLHRDYPWTKPFQSTGYQDKRSNPDPSHMMQRCQSEMQVHQSLLVGSCHLIRHTQQTTMCSDHLMSPNTITKQLFSMVHQTARPLKQVNPETQAYRCHQMHQHQQELLEQCRCHPRGSHRWVAHRLHHHNHLRGPHWQRACRQHLHMATYRTREPRINWIAITAMRINWSTRQVKERKKKNISQDAVLHDGTSTGGFVISRMDFQSRNLGTGRPTIQCTACGE